MPSVLLFASYSAPCLRRRNTACGTSVVEGRLGDTPLILPKQRDAKQRPLTGRHGNGLSRRVGSRPVRPLYDRDGWIFAGLLSGSVIEEADIRSDWRSRLLRTHLGHPMSRGRYSIADVQRGGCGGPFA